MDEMRLAQLNIKGIHWRKGMISVGLQLLKQFTFV